MIGLDSQDGVAAEGRRFQTLSPLPNTKLWAELSQFGDKDLRMGLWPIFRI